jgi:gamma-glutamyltranspeptidase/glutathione hydrolase
VPVAPRNFWNWGHYQTELRGDARRFYLHDDRPPALGSLYRHPGQAEILRRLARDGRAAFYEGEIAEDMVASLQALGGSHTLDDFAATACDWTEPVSGPYRGIELVEHPPNGQGATAILMLKILAHFDMQGLDPFGAPRAHLEAEAAKLAYDARARFIADPDHTTRLDHMLADATAAKLAALIDPKRAMALPVAPRTEAIHRDTIYVTVVDRDRMVVSMIYSIFHAFGAGLASQKFGVLFQNRGSGFTLTPGHPNEAGGGKRPMHTIIPGMLREAGRVTTSFGVMGGHFQPNGHTRLITNIHDFGMDVQEALDAPRCFADEGKLVAENGYSQAVRQELSAMGHQVMGTSEPLGGGQAIQIDSRNGVLIGGSDPRKDGCAIGY